MARVARGWSLLWRRQTDGNRYATVRFTHAGQRVAIPTGKTAPAEARAEAERLYVAYKSRGQYVPRRKAARVLALRPVVELGATYLESRTDLDPRTVDQYEADFARLVRFFGDLGAMCVPGRWSDYVSTRLGRVMAKTLRKELSIARGFLSWCEEQGVIDEAPVIKGPKKRVRGTRTGPQREKAQELSPVQVETALAAMPEWGGRGRKRFPVRARFVLEVDHGFRPETLSGFLWSDYDPTTATIEIRPENDKNRYGRPIDLSRRAQAALLELWNELPATRLDGSPSTLRAPEAPIFGHHDYRTHLARAAKSAGLKTLCAYDLRHAKGTHMADEGAPVTAIMYDLGHRNPATSGIYTHASRRASREAQALRPAPPAPLALPPGPTSDYGSSADLVSGKPRAKEGSRTPTGVTPPEPEWGRNQQNSAESGGTTEAYSPPETGENRQGGGDNGSPRSTIAEGSFLSAESSLYDAGLELDLERKRGAVS